MINIKVFTFNAFSENTYILSDDSLEAVIIDPGCSNLAERNELHQHITENNLKVVKLLNTHAHIDHVLGNHFVKETFGVPYYLHQLDLPILQAAQLRASHWGFKGYVGIEPDFYLEEGQNITFGNSTLEVYFTPGHAPGHVIFVNRVDNFCICGDVIFKNSIGRTDFDLCNHEHLLESIKTKIFTLPDNMFLFSGHGANTTVGREKIYNPYVGQNAQN